MRILPKICLSFAALFTTTVALTACDLLLPLEGSSSSVENSSILESSFSWESSSSAEDSSSISPISNPMWEIVDALYELASGEYLEGEHTLTGRVSYIGKSGKKNVIEIVVDGRESKPIYCYGITGAELSTLQVGDIATVRGKLTNYKNQHYEFDSGCVLVDAENLLPDENDPYVNISKAEFYANYSPATSAEDAYFRSLHGFMSGELTIPDQAPTLSSNRPKKEGRFIRNSQMHYAEENMAYNVVTSTGERAFTVYRYGAYVTLEEVAAFVYAFGTYPANYVESKNLAPSDSVWGEYLRLNHTRFSGDTSSYPYEPILPNISGCGGELFYYEMDIGTTGTDCDPSYPTAPYNDGYAITRGAARIVYGKTDLDKDGVYEENEFHLFYTYNHYNDFQEYLNYQGGWGEMFGNITGGGSISSTTHYRPTAYVPVYLEPLPTNYKAAIQARIALQK